MRLLVLGLLCIAGCAQRFEGPELVEKGKVTETCYVPPGHYQDTDYSYINNPDGTFITTPVPVTRRIPARYAVIFRCQHGQFVIDGDQAQDLWKRLPRGTPVMIRYHEVFEVNDGLTNLVDMRFVDAVVLSEKVQAEKD